MVLISCVKSKRDHPCPASEMYISPLYRKSLTLARKMVPDDHIRILSARYGLLRLDDIIEPYNHTLIGTSPQEKRDWAGKVLDQMKASGIDLRQTFVMLAGEAYVRPLAGHLRVECPMKGLSMGRRIHWLNAQLEGHHAQN